MSKLQVLVRGERDTPCDAFARAVLGDLAPVLLEAGATRLKVTLTEEPPPRLSVIPFSRRRIALLSAWSDDNAQLARDAGAAAEGAGLIAHAYAVTDSTPLLYERTWPDGERTPGVGLLTVFDRKPGLDDATFMHRWQAGHSTLSLKLHPLWCYVRNVVEAPVLDGSPPRDAIVEEHFRRRRDLLSPRVFFGGALRMLPNMVRVGLDVRGFIDLSTIETYLVNEYHVRS